MEERLLYKSRSLQAIQQPSDFMSIIIDGMNTCYVPMKLPMPKGILDSFCSIT